MNRMVNAPSRLVTLFIVTVRMGQGPAPVNDLALMERIRFPAPGSPIPATAQLARLPCS